jgi:hypothetical protein
LQRNVLVFKSANIETKFLSESELPRFARLNNNGEGEDEISMLTENPTTSSGSSSSSINYKEMKYFIYFSKSRLFNFEVKV